MHARILQEPMLLSMWASTNLPYMCQIAKTVNPGHFVGLRVGVDSTHVAPLGKRVHCPSPISTAWDGELQQLWGAPTMAASAANSLSRQAPWGHQPGARRQPLPACKRGLWQQCFPTEAFSPVPNTPHRTVRTPTFQDCRLEPSGLCSS